MILAHNGGNTNILITIAISPSCRAVETDCPEGMGDSRHSFSRECQRSYAPHGTHGHADARCMCETCGWQARPVQSRPLTLTQIDEEVRAHAVKMALIHDLGEAVIGDITPSDGISKGNLGFLLKEID